MKKGQSCFLIHCELAGLMQAIEKSILSLSLFIHLLFNMSSRYDLSLEEKMNLIQDKE